jgi:predicted MFS family arabinose efflux permease
MQSRWRVLAILTAARTSLGFQFQSIASVSSDAVPALELSYGELGLLIGLYFLPGVAIALPAGAASRRFGDKRLILFGLMVMTLGALACSLATTADGLAVGRIVSGIGGIVLNVVMSKVVVDWFTSREIVLAMSVFVSAFPIGIGLALLTLGGLSSLAGWNVAMAFVGFVTLAPLLWVWKWCDVHPNDAQVRKSVSQNPVKLNKSEWTLVVLGGSIWGMFNGSFAVLFSFAPDLLVRSGGASAVTIGALVGVATWIVAASTQVGGILGQHWVKPRTLLVCGSIVWALCLFALALKPEIGPVAVVGACLAMGLPVGAIMSLPSEALRPETRGVGISYFFLWLYVGYGLVPPLAGWLRDVTGQASAPLLLSAGTVVVMLVLYITAQALIARIQLQGNSDAPLCTRTVDSSR